MEGSAQCGWGCVLRVLQVGHGVTTQSIRAGQLGVPQPARASSAWPRNRLDLCLAHSVVPQPLGQGGLGSAAQVWEQGVNLGG